MSVLVKVDELVRALLSQDEIIHISVVIVHVGFALLLGHVFPKHFCDCGGTLSLIEVNMAFNLKLSKVIIYDAPSGPLLFTVQSKMF